MPSAFKKSSPDFDSWFLRPSLYELVEGPYVTGTQHVSHLYYTLPLVYGAMTAFIQSLRIQCRRHLLLTTLILFAATFLNIRIGGLAFLLMLLYLLASSRSPFIPRPKLAALLSIPFAFALFALLTMLNPTFMKNTGVLVREGIWLTSFISVAALHLAIYRRPIQKGIVALSPPAQRIAFAFLGYLSLYCILFVAHKAYYGNFLRAGDFSAAAAILDWSLVGILLAIKNQYPTPHTMKTMPTPGSYSGSLHSPQSDSPHSVKAGFYDSPPSASCSS